MSDTSLNDAAKTVQTAELNALKAIKDAVEAFVSALDAATADLDYPENFASNATRVAISMKSNVVWQKNEVTGLVATMTGATVAPTMPDQAS